jgi:transcriptional regulator with XRE-family HTH domain
MDEQLIAVGKRVSNLRKSLGLTQEKLAEAADISVQFLVKIEGGKMNMKIGTLRKLCSALSVSADYIINGTESNVGSAEVDSLLAQLSAEDRVKAIKMLAAFVEILSGKND